MRSLRAVRAEGERIAEFEARARASEAMESVRRHVRRMPGVMLSSEVPKAGNDNVPGKSAGSFKPPVVVSPAAWEGEPVPEREWFLADLVPIGQVTILAGDGGVGKSLLALQWAAAAATDGETIGGKPQSGRVVYLGAEDDRDEFHRRLASIMAAQGRDLSDLHRFNLIPMADMDALLSVPDRAGKMQPTPLWEWFVKQVPTWNPTLIVLDTVADLFGGDEIKRAQARQFVAMLRKVAIEHKCAIILLAHPSVEGMKSGTGSSGSTGWRNSSRSQLYLTRPDDKDADPDLRELKTVKSNYGQTGGSIRMRWQDGVFVPDDGTKVTPAAKLMAKRADDVFVELLSKFTHQGQRLGVATGTNYAPTKMAKQPEAKGISRRDLEAAMQRLLDAGTIKLLWEGPPSKQRQRLVVSAEDYSSG